MVIGLRREEAKDRFRRRVWDCSPKCSAQAYRTQSAFLSLRIINSGAQLPQPILYTSFCLLSSSSRSPACLPFGLSYPGQYLQSINTWRFMGIVVGSVTVTLRNNSSRLSDL